MEKCQYCKINYPDGYLSPLMTSKGNCLVCGICALELSNKVTGLVRKKFQGETAEDFRQMALRYREEIKNVQKEKN